MNCVLGTSVNCRYGCLVGLASAFEVVVSGHTWEVQFIACKIIMGEPEQQVIRADLGSRLMKACVPELARAMIINL